ncbi:GtrA family protein [Vulcaniibacterium tengchongense]|uniref:Putative flippase GtrA n=1 Tax=Vulcaniibacterium tengchongense TaxID=1273429 RepID=A0A3N4VS00_9GAMM|nr:GtrA family protein [Vulcaniibacterium tengchongense]RPE75834.1 putative flippase GtrA [Vulcaniibacterium tengchongense]
MIKRLIQIPLLRQGGSYFAIGLLQLLVDWATFVALSGLGLAVEPANVAGRIGGALLGFWLNGRFTFAGEGTAVGRRQLARFVLLWLATTAVSTWALTGVERAVGLKWAWFAKPAVDLGLSAAGFLLSRHWVYRR